MNKPSEKEENQKYKDFIETQLEAKNFCIFRREKQFDHLFPEIAAHIKEGANNLLDLCCGQGRLIHYLKQDFSQLKIHGIDYMDTLIAQAKDNFQNESNISLEIHDAFEISKKYNKAFDLTVIYKTVSWLPYYETIVAEAIKVTKKSIFITSLFWDGDIDFITKISVGPLNGVDNFSYLNTYSLPKFQKFCMDHGAKEIKSKKMSLEIDLPKPDANILQTYTTRLEDGSFAELTGPIQLHWKLIEICL